MSDLRLRKPAIATSTPLHGITEDSRNSWVWDLVIFFALALGGLVILGFFLFFMLSPMTEEEWKQMRVPFTLQDAQRLGAVLASFRDRHFWRVVAGHAACYLYLQTFAIPGTVFFNLLGGALFGMEYGYPMCLFYNTIGSICLYTLGKLLGGRIVERFFIKQMEQFRGWVKSYERELLWKMIFLRIMPFTPNWFINVACGQLRIPVWKFALSIAIGLTPYNFLSCKAGLVLSELTSRNAIIDTTTTIWLAVIAILGLFGPAIARRVTTM
eukprot:m.228644 g.228644  ORF g.228644 m.228644 type:complete len:269 (+) comp17540_c0_seq1:836-1642(+)